jgi:hypothetical protein
VLTFAPWVAGEFEIYLAGAVLGGSTKFVMQGATPNRVSPYLVPSTLCATSRASTSVSTGTRDRVDVAERLFEPTRFSDLAC